MNNLKTLIVAATTLMTTGCSTMEQYGYLKIGAGYKVDQTEIHYRDGSTDHPISARFEAGIEKGSLKNPQWKFYRLRDGEIEWFRTTPAE